VRGWTAAALGIGVNGGTTRARRTNGESAATSIKCDNLSLLQMFQIGTFATVADFARQKTQRPSEREP
jgi:hypothetical protein